MRVRLASSHARRPAALPTRFLLVTLVAVALVAPTAGAVPSPRAAAGATASNSSGLRVTNLDIPAVEHGAATETAKALELSAEPSGRLLAHLSTDSMKPFSMLGVTWDHQEAAPKLTVEIRTLTDGGWTDWGELETDLDGGPVTTAEDSAFRDGTEPDWVGSSTGVEVAVYGKGAAPSGLEVSTIDPGESPAALADNDIAEADSDLGKPGTFPHMPNVITRKEWGADESLGDACWDPRYGRTFKAVVVHHTAGSNDYTRDEAAAVVRGILAYHTQSRGWCDIGYNFLVDRFGDVYEGRAGGIRLPVRGAHAGDYNVNTTGISLMGNFDVEKPTTRMKNALVRLVSWRLGSAYHGAYGHPFVFDHRIDRISGHRDVMSTACPGRYVYDWLPRLRHLVTDRLGEYESRIEKVWARDGRKASDLGVVAIGEQRDNGGRYTAFRHGRIYLDDDGVHTLYKGPVLRRYLKVGGTSGFLGYPRSDVRAIGRNLGYTAKFKGGRIYWSSETGAEALRRSAILQKYLSLRAAKSDLGFPETGVVEKPIGSRTRFEHGAIIHNKRTHRTIVRYR
jgi:uncharacterized protein with LGFP repeats